MTLGISLSSSGEWTVISAYLLGLSWIPKGSSMEQSLKHTAQYVGHTHISDARRGVSDLCLAELKKISNNRGGVQMYPR